ncbi:MAG: formate dehydrogenase accessory sulfurtransferase FdhD, partial [Deltaproteobacteria bacterium]|nr:formate dehydrogenase accessory sulfurtransferase FdhD [Deltaproteobacteria bacterium]
GGTHSAVVFDASGKPLQVAEDIGRHNAVDKVVGYCALHKIQLEDKILPTAGRASYEMAIKAIHMKIPIIAAISAPTSLALQTAQECRLTIIGYLRRIRMNVYTHPYRLRKN